MLGVEGVEGVVGCSCGVAQDGPAKSRARESTMAVRWAPSDSLWATLCFSLKGMADTRTVVCNISEATVPVKRYDFTRIVKPAGIDIDKEWRFLHQLRDLWVEAEFAFE